jgi:hypothetical protein
MKNETKEIQMIIKQSTTDSKKQFTTEEERALLTGSTQAMN